MRHVWLNMNAPQPCSVMRQMDDKRAFVFQRSIMETSEEAGNSGALSVNAASNNTSPSFLHQPRGLPSLNRLESLFIAALLS